MVTRSTRLAFAVEVSLNSIQSTRPSCSDEMNVFPDELHLSKVDSIVQLRPQLSHLDALQDLENSVARNQRDLDNGGEPSEARAINMSVKSAENEDMDLSIVAKTLRNMAEEPWQPLRWIDEEVKHLCHMPKLD